MSLRSQSSLKNAAVSSLMLNPIQPWARKNYTINTDVAGVATKKDLTAEALLAKTLACLDRYSADITIYTDGSAGDCANGGSGFVVATGTPQSPDVLVRGHAAGGSVCSSYTTEVKALTIGLISAQDVICQLGLQSPNVLVCTDSLSALSRLAHPKQVGSADEVKLLVVLNQMGKISNTYLQWVPNHIGLLGNEMADSEADAGCHLPQLGVGVPYSAARALVKRSSSKLVVTHDLVKAVHGEHAECSDSFEG